MKVISLCFALLFGTMVVAQEKKQEKKQEVVIVTSAECGTCKKIMEEKLNYTKGILFADLDVPTQKLTVKFKTKNISADQIRTIISELGYDADDVKAVPEKVLELPKCCQPGGMKN